MFGDRDLKKLRRELEDGRIAMQLGPRLGPDAMKVGVANTLRDLRAAARGMSSAGRWHEARAMIKASRFADPDPGEEAWNSIVDTVVSELDGGSDRG